MNKSISLKLKHLFFYVQVVPLWTLEQANQLPSTCKASVGNSQRATLKSIPPLVKQNLSYVLDDCSRTPKTSEQHC